MGPAGRLVSGSAGAGRGASLCRGSVSCVAEALRRHAVPRALRITVSPEALAELPALVGVAAEGGGGPEVWEDKTSGRTAGARPDTGKGS